MSKKSMLGLKELIAIGVGGMIGGGIFSVLGMAVEISGNAAPIAFVSSPQEGKTNISLICNHCSTCS